MISMSDDVSLAGQELPTLTQDLRYPPLLGGVCIDLSLHVYGCMFNTLYIIVCTFVLFFLYQLYWMYCFWLPPSYLQNFSKL